MGEAFFWLVVLGAIAVQLLRRLSEEELAALEAQIMSMFAKAGQAIRDGRDRIMRRRLSYRHVFMNERGELHPAGRVVLADLTRFCRMLTTTTQVSPVTRVVDPIATAQAEGRREVFLRIMKELKLDPAAVMQLSLEEDALAA